MILQALSGLYGSEVVTFCVRGTLDELRQGMASDTAVEGEEEVLSRLVEAVENRLERRVGRRLRRMLNATGIFLHTNLGRAPLPPSVAQQVPQLLDAYCDLEIERETGRRGDRNRRSARLLETITGFSEGYKRGAAFRCAELEAEIIRLAFIIDAYDWVDQMVNYEGPEHEE